MILYGFLLLVAVSCAVSLSRWRAGLWFIIVLGSLQDPVRKMVPGAPAYLALTTVPVWFSLLIGALVSGDLSWERFTRILPGPSKWMVLFILCLIPPAVMSMTYSPGSWQFTLLGAYAYGSVLAVILVGVFYPRKDGDLERLLSWYVGVNAVFLIGSPLEPLGIGTASGLVGTSSLDTVWVSYHVAGKVTKLYAGFFRSPDVMGWHATTVVMFSLLLAVRSAGWRRVLFFAAAGWGGIGLVICARRKMVAALAVFAVVLIALLFRYGQARRVGLLLALMVAGVAVSTRLYQLAGADNSVGLYYGTLQADALDRVQKHGVDTVLVTIRQAGVFGYGLGMAVQGAQNIKAARPRIWQESALDKAAAEIGVPGLLALFLLLGGFVAAAHRMLVRIGSHPGGWMVMGLAALLVANASGAVVSSQIFGDPYIGTFIVFLLGLMFSGARLAPAAAPAIPGPRQPVPRPSPAVTPA